VLCHMERCKVVGDQTGSARLTGGQEGIMVRINTLKVDTPRRMRGESQGFDAGLADSMDQVQATERPTIRGDKSITLMG